MTPIPCPACGLALDFSHALPGQALACPRCHASFDNPGDASLAVAVGAQTTPGSGAHARTRSEFLEGSSLLHLFDLSFKRFATPSIVRLTWFALLIVAAIWLLFVTVTVASVALSDSPRASSAPGGLQRSQNPLEVSAAAMIGRQTGRVFFSLVILTQIVLTGLSFLWIRVGLESAIVLFHIAGSLKSLDEKTPCVANR
jgi:hypothetical protein